MTTVSQHITSVTAKIPTPNSLNGCLGSTLDYHWNSLPRKLSCHSIVHYRPARTAFHLEQERFEGGARALRLE